MKRFWKAVKGNRWNNLPLAVFLTLSACLAYDLRQRSEWEGSHPHKTISYEYTFHGQLPALFAAVEEWNTQLGWNYFQLRESDGKIRVITTDDKRIFDNEEKVGVYGGDLDGGNLFILPGVPDCQLLRTIIEHELGHALNITYDEIAGDPFHSIKPGSLMFPYVDEEVRPTPSPEDVRRAKESLQVKE